MSRLAALIILGVCLVKVRCENVECKDSSLQCAEKEMLRLLDNLDNKKSVSIFGDMVTLEKTGSEKNAASEDVIERSLRFLQNYELKIKLPKRSSRSLVTDSRSSKIKKILLPLLLLLKLKAAVVIPAVLSAVALVAFKGLGVSLIALAIAGALAFKQSLDTSQSSKFTYEVVPPSPHWSRVGGDPLVSNPAYHALV